MSSSSSSATRARPSCSTTSGLSWVLGGSTLERRSELQARFEREAPAETILKHRTETPLPPSQLAELPVPASFDALVLECLAKDPEHRPPSAAVLADRLARIDQIDSWSAECAREWWDLHHPLAPPAARGGRRPIPL